MKQTRREQSVLGDALQCGMIVLISILLSASSTSHAQSEDPVVVQDDAPAVKPAATSEGSRAKRGEAAPGEGKPGDGKPVPRGPDGQPIGPSGAKPDGAKPDGEKNAGDDDDKPKGNVPRPTTPPEPPIQKS